MVIIGYVKKIIDKLLKLQNRFYPEVKEYYTIGKGKISLLRVIGVDGESVLLKCNGSRIEYARGDETPEHIFRCTTDTFLDIISGEETLREAITKGHFSIENSKTGTIDLVEMQRWASAFERLKGIVRRYVRV